MLDALMLRVPEGPESLKRPAQPRHGGRARLNETPTAWVLFARDYLGLGKQPGITAWQALYASANSEVKSLVMRVVMVSTCSPDPGYFVSYGLTPRTVLRCLELITIEGRLSGREAAELEEAVLAKIDCCGKWKPVRTPQGGVV